MKSSALNRFIFLFFLLVLAHHPHSMDVASVSNKTNSSMMIFNSTQSSPTYDNYTIALYSVLSELENSTLSQLEPLKARKMLFSPQLYLLQALFLIQGLALLLMNGLLFIGLVWKKELRNQKEYTSLGAMALCDAANGYRLMVLAAYRLSLDGWQPSRLASSLDCLIVNLVAIFFMLPLQPVMFAVMSLDRLLAVVVPVRYLGWGMRYSLSLSGGAYLFVVLVFLFLSIITITSHFSSPVYEYQWSCVVGWALPKGFVLGIFNIFWVITGVIISAMLLVVFWYKNKADPETSHNEQIQLTKTIGLSSIVTVVFYAIPSLAMFFIRRFTNLYTQPFFLVLAQYAIILMMTNSVIQPVLVIYRQKDIRDSIKKLPVLRKFLPKPVAPARAQTRQTRQSLHSINNTNANC